MPFFVGQRYVPNGDQELAVEQADRVRVAVEQAAMQGLVRLLSTTFVPNEEWVFDVFEADSAGQVERVYSEGNVPFERVAEAVHLT
jgi:hypothetical protein